MQFRGRFLLTIILAVVVLIGINMLARSVLYNARLDLTENARFTISDETKTMLTSLEEPMRVRFFFAEEVANGLPVFQSYAARIRGMLRQYEDLSDGQLSVEFINPEPFTEAEDIAVSHGIEGISVDGVGNKFYFGLSVENSTDDRGVIPFFDPERDRFLEYEISQLIYKVAYPEKKKVGILTSLPIRGGGNNNMMMLPSFRPWVFLLQLERHFDVQMLDKHEASIPEGLDTLMLVHPYDLSEDMQYAIDQYVLKGGKLIAFLDGHVNLEMMSFKESKLPALFRHWGVGLAEGKVASEKAAAIHVQSDDAQSRLQAFPKITWLQMNQDYLSQESVITASLNGVRMIESGFLVQDEDSPLTMEPLITTTPAAMALDATVLKTDQDDALQLFRNYVPDGEPLVLAAQVSGVVESAFPGKAGQEGHVSASEEPVTAILVADTDMLRDEFWVQRRTMFGEEVFVPNADNGAFVLNAVEYLSGSGALVTLRTRDTEDRRFTVLDALKEQAEIAFREEESRLQGKLKQMEVRMRELQAQEQEGDQLFSQAQASEIKSFRNAFLETRKQLRAVQRELSRDIELLGMRIALLNIVVVPLAVLVLSFLLPGWLRRRKA